MGSEIGDIGQHLAAAVAKLRASRRWDQKALAARVTEAGRPMSASVLGKVEAGTRRVDVDDLVALAFALEVPAAKLLLAAGRDIPTEDDAQAASDPPASGTGPVRAAVTDDIETLGDLEILDPMALSLAAIAVRLAQEVDRAVSESGPLHSLAKELRETLAQLRALAPEEPLHDDGLGDDLASPD